MAPLFAAFDRDTYEWTIPQHLADLADIQHYLDCILQCLQAGGFTVSLTGKTFHLVTFDEAHKMCINKHMKTAVTHASEVNLQKTPSMMSTASLCSTNTSLSTSKQELVKYIWCLIVPVETILTQRNMNKLRRCNKNTTKKKEHCNFDVNTAIPPFWQELMEYLTCKRARAAPNVPA